MYSSFVHLSLLLLFVLNGLSVIEKPAHAQPYDTSQPVFRSVTEFGKVGTTDDSATFQNALNETKNLSIPPGTYRVQNLVPRNGTTIFASREAIIRGVTDRSAIFHTTQFTQSVLIEGGKWKQTKYVWFHTGNSALAKSSFLNMEFSNLGNAAFSLSAAVGNRWEGCSFVKGYDYGLHFTGKGTGQTNANWIENTQFMTWRKNAIHFADTSIPKVANYIVRSWFEEGHKEGHGSAIFVGGGIQQLRVADSYFEEAGYLNYPDIDIVQNQGANITSILIENNHFAPTWPNKSQAFRIRNKGHSGFVAKNNTVVLRDGQIFAAIDGQVNRSVNLLSNYLVASGGGTYESRLYSRSSKQHLVWNAYPGSGHVTEDEDERLRYIGGPGSSEE
jgi:hypothetical protein